MLDYIIRTTEKQVKANKLKLVKDGNDKWRKNFTRTTPIYLVVGIFIPWVAVGAVIMARAALGYSLLPENKAKFTDEWRRKAALYYLLGLVIFGVGVVVSAIVLIRISTIQS
jgi:hypothetical protein